jgi:UDP-N-acetylglucosamine 3-dehydrogenase
VSPLRAGLVGLGTMGRVHARVLGDLPGVELVGATDPEPHTRHMVRSIPVTAELDELIKLGLDMCVVATPTLTHTDIGLRLADAGIHTLIEKPLAPDPDSGRLLAKAFDKMGLVGCVGHIERYNPAVSALRTRLAQGELGSVFQITTHRQGPFPQRIRDVGVVMDLATHDIDLTQWVTGSRYFKVAGFTARPSGRQHEDLVAVSGVLRNGIITSHLVNWLSPVKERVVTVTGECGCLTASTLANELWFHRNGSVTTESSHGDPPFRGASEGDSIRYAVAKREALRVELENFRDAVLQKPADIVTLRQGIDTLDVANAILVASKEQTGITLDADDLHFCELPDAELIGGHREAW